MMVERRIECSIWTFNAAMCSCAKVGRWRDALKVFEMMRNYLDERGKEDSSKLSFSQADPVDAADEEAVFVLSNEANQQLLKNTVTGLASEFMNSEEADEWGDDDIEDVNSGYESYMASFNMTNIVTYNTLIQALGEGGQFLMVDDIYQDAVTKGIVNPWKNFKSEGWIDLHFHSVHMGKAALRYTFENILDDSDLYTSVVGEDGELTKGITVIIGKGAKLKRAIQLQLKNEFRPSIRSALSPRNRGRLVLSSRDVKLWLRTHMSIRGSGSREGL